MSVTTSLAASNALAMVSGFFSESMTSLILSLGMLAAFGSNALAIWAKLHDRVAVLVHGHRDGLADHRGREELADVDVDVEPGPLGQVLVQVDGGGLAAGSSARTGATRPHAAAVRAMAARRKRMNPPEVRERSVRRPRRGVRSPRALTTL